MDILKFRASEGFKFSDHNPSDLNSYQGDKEKGRADLSKILLQISELQTVFHAEDQRSVLLILQGMDTSGKDGAVKKVFSETNPMGLKIVNFKKPTSEELNHDYLWRVHKNLPERGQIGVFNRSHYEDVIVTRIKGLISNSDVKTRFRQILDFEKMLHEEGTSVIKLFLNISSEEQRKRIQERIDNPQKHWKFDLDDLESRKHWKDYLAAYEEAISSTHSNHAPWYVVPADKKWYRNLVVAQILLEKLQHLAPEYPESLISMNNIEIPEV